MVQFSRAGHGTDNFVRYSVFSTGQLGTFGNFSKTSVSAFGKKKVKQMPSSGQKMF